MSDADHVTPEEQAQLDDTDAADDADAADDLDAPDGQSDDASGVDIDGIKSEP